MLIDSHCHLPFDQAERKEVLARAQQNGVVKIITIGTSLKNSEQNIKIAQQEQNVFATVGVYPHEDLDELLDQISQKLTALLPTSNKIVAIGECGIDINDRQEGRQLEAQIQLFERQIEVALQNNLPIVIHNRNGDDYVLKTLQKYKSLQGEKLRGVAHCFVGTWELAQKFWDLGFYISFSGFITHSSKSWLAETVKKVPLDKFLLETDSPYILPAGADEPTGTGDPTSKATTKKKNEPKNVKIVAQKAAELKNLPFEQIADNSYNNTCTLFGLV